MVDDEYIKDLYIRSDGNINTNCLKDSWLSKHNDVKDYLMHRYSDSLSLTETVYRIVLGIHVRPVCKKCGSPAVFHPHHRFNRERNGNPFLEYCSNKCATSSSERTSKIKQTVTERYGVSNVMHVKTVVDKMKSTNNEIYGSDCVFGSETIKDKIKHTIRERYGVESIGSLSASRDKATATNLALYGTKTYAECEDFKRRMKERMPEILDKIFTTKSANNSFNKSDIEKRLFVELSKHFDVVRQYKSSEYPYSCDFYIKSLNLYIEYNGTWTHGKHPYNDESDEDVKQLNDWIAKSNKSKYYQNAIRVWTVTDPKKFEIAKSNKLNYLAIYSNVSFDDIVRTINDEYCESVYNKQLILGVK